MRIVELAFFVTIAYAYQLGDCNNHLRVHVSVMARPMWTMWAQ